MYSVFFIVFAGTALAACATSESGERAESERRIEETRAYIEAAKLETVSIIRYRPRYRVGYLNRQFVIIRSHDEYHLVEFEYDCAPRRNATMIDADVRRHDSWLRAGRDTLSNCRIAAFYVLPPEVGKNTYLQALRLAEGYVDEAQTENAENAEHRPPSGD